MHTLKLSGPPGTGKTHYGRNWLIEQIAAGIDPYRIAFVSFTNKACNEARARMAGVLEPGGIYADDLTYCATIHALAKRALNITDRDWLADRKLKQFAKEYDYDLSSSRRDEEEDADANAVAHGTDSPLLAVYNWTRNRLITDAQAGLRAFALYDREAADRVDTYRYGRFVADYEDWKKTNSLRDFTDLLLEVIAHNISIPVSAVVVDEAQDLPPLMWAAADRLFRHAEVSAVLADPDQAIYGFQGATPKLYLERQAQHFIRLVQSRRLSSRVCANALRVISQNSNRDHIDFQPVTPEILNERGRPWDDADLHGECRRVGRIEDLHLTNGESWMILVRNWCFVAEIISTLEASGIPYTVAADRYYSPWQDKGPLKAVKAVYALSEGETVGADGVKQLVERAKSETKTTPGAWVHGAKVKIKQLLTDAPEAVYSLRDLYALGMTPAALQKVVKHDLTLLDGGVSERDLLAYQAAQRSGEFGKPSRLTVSTIHGQKGGEADNVAAIMGCTRMPARNLDDPVRREEEVRLGYVAVSRARKRFFGVEATSGEPYEVFHV